MAIAKKVAELTRAGKLMSVAGGGDTVAALAAAGVTDDLTYVSTAGGAFLEWLEGRELPGVAALAARIGGHGTPGILPARRPERKRSEDRQRHCVHGVCERPSAR